MPFGRYKDYQVDDLPGNYLEWLIDNVDLWEPLRSEVYRQLYGCKDNVVAPDESKTKAIYRQLAQKWHPDRGGSTEAMQAVNEFYELLKRADDVAL